MTLMVYHSSAAYEMPSEVVQHCEQDLENLSHTVFESEPPIENHKNYVSVTNGRISMSSDVIQLEDEIDILADAFIKRFHNVLVSLFQIWDVNRKITRTHFKFGHEDVTTQFFGSEVEYS